MKRMSLAALVAASLVVALPQAGHAAWPVFDATNYGQNVLQAARALEQINNQIQQLQNQAVMLQNMARNLQRLDFSSLGQLQGALNRIDGLMMQVDGLSFDLTQLEGHWRQQYPSSYDATVSTSDIATAARERWQSAMNAFRQTMRVQSQIIPSPAAISRMEETLSWTVGLDPIDGKIVWLRAYGERWKTICWTVGLQRSAAHEHWLYALCVIAWRLNQRKVPRLRSRRYVIEMVKGACEDPASHPN